MPKLVPAAQFPTPSVVILPSLSFLLFFELPSFGDIVGGIADASVSFCCGIAGLIAVITGVVFALYWRKKHKPNHA